MNVVRLELAQGPGAPPARGAPVGVPQGARAAAEDPGGQRGGPDREREASSPAATTIRTRAIAVRVLTRRPVGHHRRGASSARRWPRLLRRAPAPARSHRHRQLPAHPRRGRRAAGRGGGPLRRLRGAQAVLGGAQRRTGRSSWRRSRQACPGSRASSAATRWGARTWRRTTSAGAGKMLWGAAAPELIPIRERGATFLVDAYRGQKTGFFLDQRENRFLIRRLAAGPRRPQLLLLHRRLLGERGAGRGQERVLGGSGRGRDRAGAGELHAKRPARGEARLPRGRRVQAARLVQGGGPRPST